MYINLFTIDWMAISALMAVVMAIIAGIFQTKQATNQIDQKIMGRD